MKINHFFIQYCFIALFISSSLFAKGWRPGEKQIRIPAENRAIVQQIYDLKLNMDFHGPEFNNITLYVTPQELAMIDNLGIPYNVEIEDLNQHSIDLQSELIAYHSYQEIINLADSLATHFPDICEKHIFGTSIEGRQLAALKISDSVAIDQPEAEILFDGGIHGDEVGGPENLIRFARDLCSNYGTDPTITNLIDNREIWIYLMVNPDGRHHDTRYNMNGVDLNRDFAYMWDAWGGSTGPCSQIESKALRDCMYNNQFAVHITYHSGTEYLSLPWSYRASQPLDWNHINQLAGLYSSSSGYSNLQYGQGNSGMYPINGSTKDSNYGMMGSVSWTMEISYSKHPPPSQIMLYYNRNYVPMLNMIEYAGYGLQGTITDSITGEPVAANIFVNNYFPSYSDPSAGDYHKFVLPGTYSITVVANGYRTKTVNNVVVSANSATTTNFQLQPDFGQYVYKFSSSQIPNNNSADEGLTPAVIGPPDNINYSVGRSGWCVLDMQSPVFDGSGNDFIVHEGDSSPESYTCYVGQTIDGPWISLGNGTGTTPFDISTSGLLKTQFIKIVDDGDGPSIANDAGFDLDAIESISTISGVFLALFEYNVNDSSGNNNGKIDPGETVDIEVTIKNEGNISADSVYNVIRSNSSYLTIIDSVYWINSIAQGQSVQSIFEVSAAPNTPNGEQIEISLDLVSNNGTYSFNYNMIFTVGQVPLLIIDLDNNHNSGPEMLLAIQQNGLSAEYKTSFASDFSDYNAVFVCLGVYSNNYELTAPQGQTLADYLNNGGNLYMEGGDTWFFDLQTAVHQMFNIYPISDGNGDLGNLLGQNNTFTQDMNFSYSGDNTAIDNIVPMMPAFSVFRNQSPSYFCAIAFEGSNYKTIGTSFEFGGLDDGVLPSTKQNLMAQYLEFFEIDTLQLPLAPALIAPLDSTTIDTTAAEFVWHSCHPEVTKYWFEIDTTYHFSTAFVDSTIIDTTFNFSNIQMGKTYWWRVKSGNSVAWSEFSSTRLFTTLVTSIEKNILPIKYSLSQNYPNPFNPITKIKYDIIKFEKVELFIYDVLGRKIIELINRKQSPGSYDVTFNGSNLPSGVYYYKLKTGDYSSVKKMILIK